VSCALVEDVGFEPQITFSIQEDKSISVVIETARLVLKSVEATPFYYDEYAKLFGDAAVMKSYASGQPESPETVERRINNIWNKRWKEGDPYSGFAIFKKDTTEFIGHIAFGHGYVSGQAAFAYLLHEQFWNQRYGTEAVSAVVHQYAQEIIRRGYSMEGSPLREAVATTLPSNIASGRILQGLGAKLTGQQEEYGSLRDLYTYSYPNV